MPRDRPPTASTAGHIFQVAMRFAKAGKIDPLLTLDIASNVIEPVRLVTSDKGDNAGIRIEDLVDTFVNEVLLVVMEYCGERQLYLDDLLRE